MNSIYIVRYSPLYAEKIKVLPTSYALDMERQASLGLDMLNDEPEDLCQFYAVVASSYEEAKNKVAEKIKNKP